MAITLFNPGKVKLRHYRDNLYLASVPGRSSTTMLKMVNRDGYIDFEPEQAVNRGFVGWLYNGITTTLDGKTYKIRDRQESSAEHNLLSI